MEQEFVRWLCENLPPNPLLKVGIGDDAAVIRWEEDGDLVVTTDAVTDEIDFVLAETTPALVGHKALGINLSDLAAMAAVPAAAVVSLMLPRRGAGELDAYRLAVEIYRGMLPLAEKYGVALAGGDTNTWDHPLAISITAFGRTTARGPLTRSGARDGDLLLITGSLGGSILGRHLRVEPRVREALLLHERYELHAGMDISDGLALDASRLAAASGCGVALQLDRIPIAHAAAKLSAQSGRPAIEHALGDGEDFELLLAAPPDEAARMVREKPLETPISIIGACIATPGLWQVDSQRQELAALPASGYLHG